MFTNSIKKMGRRFHFTFYNSTYSNDIEFGLIEIFFATIATFGQNTHTHTAIQFIVDLDSIYSYFGWARPVIICVRNQITTIETCIAHSKQIHTAADRKPDPLNKFDMDCIFL